MQKMSQIRGTKFSNAVFWYVVGVSDQMNLNEYWSGFIFRKWLDSEELALVCRKYYKLNEIESVLLIIAIQGELNPAFLSLISSALIVQNQQKFW
jgi:hypothetical protein